jgi:hypothetical protein
MMWRGVLLACVALACGARTELGSPCVDCDASDDVVGSDVGVDAAIDSPKDAPADVSKDVVPPQLCGNGVLDPGEQCDFGAGNTNTPIPFKVTQSATTLQVFPLVRAKSATAFYDYVGASSFTGLEVAFESRLYLYVDSTANALSLIVNHNIFKQGGSGNTTMTFGLPAGFSIALSDDAGELTATSATSAQGNWTWSQNTDGGVISNLACPAAWSITATANFKKGISSWNWVNADTSRSALTFGETVTIQSFDRCRADCTIPLCGE